MTPADRLIPFYIWFQQGQNLGAILMGLISFGMALITMITVKGIYVPLWIIPIAGFAIVLMYIVIGWVFEHYDIWSRINSHYNQRQNPEIKQMSEDIKKCREILEARQ